MDSKLLDILKKVAMDDESSFTCYENDEYECLRTIYADLNSISELHGWVYLEATFNEMGLEFDRRSKTCLGGYIEISW
jgi:hypothetical protein